MDKISQSYINNSVCRAGPAFAKSTKLSGWSDKGINSNFTDFLDLRKLLRADNLQETPANIMLYYYRRENPEAAIQT